MGYRYLKIPIFLLAALFVSSSAVAGDCALKSVPLENARITPVHVVPEVEEVVVEAVRNDRTNHFLRKLERCNANKRNDACGRAYTELSIYLLGNGASMTEGQLTRLKAWEAKNLKALQAHEFYGPSNQAALSEIIETNVDSLKIKKDECKPNCGGYFESRN